MVIKSDNPSIF